MKTLLIASFMIVVAAGPLTAQTADDRVIASSSEWSITAGQFENILKALPDQARNYFSNPANRRQFLDDLIEMWVLAAEARSKDIDKQPELKAQIEFYMNNFIAREYSQQIMNAKPITDGDVESFYKQNEVEFTEVKVSHILIVNNDNEDVKAQNIPGALSHDEAKKKIEDVKAKMRGGQNFEDLAKEFSQDERSARSGGDIGFIKKGQLVPEVDKVAFSLTMGGFSDIVESPIGFHILQVTDRRVTPFEEVREEVRQRMTSEYRQSQIDSRIKAVGVKIDEAFFKQQQ